MVDTTDQKQYSSSERPDQEEGKLGEHSFTLSLNNPEEEKGKMNKEVFRADTMLGGTNFRADT